MKRCISAVSAVEYIQRKEPFYTSNRSMTGNKTYWISVYGTTLEGSYQVWSYQTLIAEFYDGVWYLNETSYSSTTSKHQMYVRRALQGIYTHDTIHLYHQRFYVDRLWDKVDGRVARQRIERIKRENKSALVSRYKVTGTDRNGNRFKAIITDNYWYARGINLYNGTKWQQDVSGKWNVIQRVYN